MKAAEPEDLVMILSVKHSRVSGGDLYWKANRDGYTNQVSRAGLYKREEAKEICGEINRDRPEQEDNRIVEISNHEDALLGSDWQKYLADNGTPPTKDKVNLDLEERKLAVAVQGKVLLPEQLKNLLDESIDRTIDLLPSVPQVTDELRKSLCHLKEMTTDLAPSLPREDIAALKLAQSSVMWARHATSVGEAIKTLCDKIDGVPLILAEAIAEARETAPSKKTPAAHLELAYDRVKKHLGGE